MSFDARQLGYSQPDSYLHPDERRKLTRMREQAAERRLRQMNPSPPSPTNWNELLLSSLERPVIDFEHASRVIKCTPGKAVVEMHNAAKRASGILLPASGRLLPDVGTLLSIGQPTEQQIELGADLIPLAPGDTVLCRPDDGMWFEHFEHSGYVAQGRVKFFGIAGTRPEHLGEEFAKDRGEYETVPWYESIPAKIEGETLIANYPNILIKREKVEVSLHMPDSFNPYHDTATVIGGKWDGKRIVYQVGDGEMLTFSWGEDEDLALIPAYCVLSEAA